MIKSIATLVLICCSGVFAQERPKFGIAASASTLGFGAQAGTAISRTENVRFGLNFFNYNHTLEQDGIPYAGTLHLRSAEVIFDQYIGRVFHVSPGFLLYDGNQAKGSADIALGRTFSLGDVTYSSDPTSPAAGSGRITARKAAPEILFGFGNLLPRKAGHFATNVEFGVAFQGSPQAELGLTGRVCGGNSLGSGCISASDPTVQANIRAEQDKLNKDLLVFKFYPIFRVTLGYKF